MSEMLRCIVQPCLVSGVQDGPWLTPHHFRLISRSHTSRNARKVELAEILVRSEAYNKGFEPAGVGDGGHLVILKGGVTGGATDRHTMALDDDFQQAAKDAGDKLPSSLPNEDKLVLYGLYKQATVGDNQSSRPGMFDPKGRAKWDAWEAQKGKEQDVAKQEYIMKVQQLKEAHGVS